MLSCRTPPSSLPAPYQDTDSSTNGAPTPFPTAVSCQAEMRVYPSTKLAGMFSAQILAALIIPKVGAIYPSICPVFSRISKVQKRCILLLTPTAAKDACEPSPSESARSQHSCSCSPASRAQHHTAQPKPSPATLLLPLSFLCKSMKSFQYCREAHYAGNASDNACPWMAWRMKAVVKRRCCEMGWAGLPPALKGSHLPSCCVRAGETGM